MLSCSTADIIWDDFCIRVNIHVHDHVFFIQFTFEMKLRRIFGSYSTTSVGTNCYELFCKISPLQACSKCKDLEIHDSFERVCCSSWN